MDAAQRLRQTMALLDGVDRRTREIYIAHRSGLTYPEIAAVWGVSNRTVKKSVARALLSIMENLEHAHDSDF
jgi:DNA-directed RNA polymerase specialized sigma24 family protein